LTGCAVNAGECISTFVNTGLATIFATLKIVSLLVAPGSSVVLDILTKSADHIKSIATLVKNVKGLVDQWKEMFSYLQTVYET